MLYGSGEVAEDRYWGDREQRYTGGYEPVSADPALLTRLVAGAEAEWGAGRVARIEIEHRKNQEPFVEISCIPGERVGGFEAPVLRFSARDGSALPLEDHRGGGMHTERVLLALHEGLFAGWALRWLYFISGLMGCAVIATGLVLWSVKRRQKHIKGASGTDRFGLRLVEVLNAGTIIGLCFGIALFFLANRLLPLQMDQRAEWEFHALFLGWGWALLWASLRPLKRAWIELCWLTFAACLAVPLGELPDHR